jgi:hypothetical protein
MNVGSLELGIGNELIALRNDYELGVLNGDRGPVVAVDDDRHGVTFLCERTGSPLRLPLAYIALGHVDYGYALTIHKTQGATYDRCLVFVDDGVYRQAAYTALSRGVAGNAMFAVNDLADDPHRSPDQEPAEEWDQVRSVTSRLSTDRSQSMALDGLDPARRERIRARLIEALTTPVEPTRELEAAGIEFEIDLPDFGP